MNLLVQSLAVGLAGFVGAVARFLVGRLCSRLFDTAFPIGTLVINVTGSFFLGWFLTRAARGTIGDTAKLMIGVGFVGAYTTFSTLMYESDQLVAEKAWIMATLNMAGSFILGMVAVRLGVVIGKG